MYKGMGGGKEQGSDEVGQAGDAHPPHTHRHTPKGCIIAAHKLDRARWDGMGWDGEGVSPSERQLKRKMSDECAHQKAGWGKFRRMTPFTGGDSLSMMYIRDVWNEGEHDK
ncbi:hypothetical protein BJ684DRAFT_14970 [Piptocephalis cylindrospora]|uniref:Uncharacterized protein n=1 Tax=Piptocephalis cylindrospora TaxID=1907219 RepID=A0A4P9Y8M5_9FUNG|nr:hypothetical protein BJ684DRAFT_14970 [Piptocephalis cylindrospora]|eukprot:RKP14711.1 hypothetical protein BJ684DRAFT_14970 [Piptocephalis cylindrospora]